MLKSRWTIWALTLALLLTACGTTARKRVGGDLVQDVTFRGNGAVREVQLRSQMTQTRSGWLVRVPLLRRFWRAVPLDRKALDEDTYRLEVWLAHYGYFDSRFEGWAVRQLRKRRYRKDGSLKKAGVVRVVGYLELGEASVVDNVDIQFLHDARALKIIGRTVKRRSYLQPRSQFLLDNVDYMRDDLLRSLHDKGRAYATVKTKVDAWPGEKKVDVLLTAEPGPLAWIGPISVVGNEQVRESDIRDVLGVEEGVQYSAGRLGGAQQALVGMGVFSVARVVPDLSDPTVTKVPIRVEVTEGKMRTFRAGLGGSWDGNNLQPTTSLSYKDVMPGKRPGLFEAEVHASMQTAFKPFEVEPLGGVSVGQTWPRYFSKKSDLRARLAAEKASLTNGQGLPYYKGEATVGTSTRIDTFGLDRFRDRVVLGVATKLEAYKWGGNLLKNESNLSPDEQERQDLLIQALTGLRPEGESGEQQVRNPFVLPILEATLTMDWRTDREDRDVVLDPISGYYYSLGVRQAVPWSSKAYRFTNLWGESRLYWSPRFSSGRWLTLAVRGRAQWLPTLRSDAAFEERVPYSERAFMGGSQDMRGFRQNHIGPYNCICDPELRTSRTRQYLWFGRVVNEKEELLPNVSFAPRGGAFAGLLSTEARVRLGSGRTIAAFADAGLMLPNDARLPGQPASSLLQKVRYDGGIGYRQATPVGPIRFDLAIRPSYPEDLGPQSRYSTDVSPLNSNDVYYYGCDDFSDSELNRRIPGLGVSKQYGRSLPPVVFNFSIGIGEAL